MNHQPVRSSHIQSVGYDPQARTLEIHFTNGKRYSYADVPAEVHSGLLAADSAGKYFHARVKSQFEGQPSG